MENLCKRWPLILGLGLVLIIGLCSGSFAGGIKISPGAFCLQEINVGEDTDLGVDLVIYNLSDEEQVFIVKTLKPSEAAGKLLKGYNDIPDASWFYFTENKIKIEPNGKGKLRMHLKIPDEDKYLNQHWIVYVETTPEAKTMFRMALLANYMIETRSEGDIKEKPYGVLGLVPSIVRVEEVILGEKKKVNFKIYNNDEVEHTYKLTSYIPELSAAKLDISVSPGYEWVKDEDWIKLDKSWFELGGKQIKLKPGEAKDVTLSVTIPKGWQWRDEGWECIILVEPDNGLNGFVRVQAEMSES